MPARGPSYPPRASTRGPCQCPSASGTGPGQFGRRPGPGRPGVRAGKTPGDNPLARARAGRPPPPSLPPSPPPSLPPLRLPGRLRTLKNSAEEPPNSAPTPGASADGVRGAWSGRPTRPASVGSSGTAASHPPQAFPLDRSGRSFLRSVGRSVRPSVRHRGRPRVLVDPRGRPHSPTSPAGTTSGPEVGRRRAGATGTIPPAPPACWKSSAGDAAKSRPSWHPEGTDDIKAAARWRPTTVASVSGTEPDLPPARATRRPARGPISSRHTTSASELPAATARPRQR